MKIVFMFLIFFCCQFICILQCQEFNKTNPPTQKWHETILESHNKLRRTVVPPAANMNHIVFNQTMADLAQKAAERCDFLHSWGEKSLGEYSTFGENIFKGGYVTPDRVVMAWFSERYFFTYDEPWTVENCEKGKVCGHYTQVAAHTVGQIGCGYKLCPKDKWVYLYCLYNRGNRNPPYFYGQDCSSCMEGYNFCHKGQCVSNNIESSPKTCELKCRNCGVLDKEKCQCKCPAGTIGSICQCSDKYKSDCLPVDSPCKGVCVRRGTPCQNNGIDISTGHYCKCKCPDGYIGILCEVETSDLVKTVAIKLKGVVPYYDKIFPISKFEFQTDLAPQLYTDLHKNIFKSCSSKDMFKKCCTKATSAPSKQFTDDSKISYISFYPQNNLEGELVVPIIMAVDSTICPGEGYLSPDILIPLVNETFSTHSVLTKKSYRVNSVNIVTEDFFVTETPNQSHRHQVTNILMIASVISSLMLI